MAAKALANVSFTSLAHDSDWKDAKREDIAVSRIWKTSQRGEPVAVGPEILQTLKHPGHQS